MRHSKLFLVLCIMGIGALIVSAPASAEVINATTGVQLFYDGYEGAPAVSHAAYPDATGDYDPVAVVGTGTIVVETNYYDGQVTDIVHPYLTQESGGETWGEIGPYSGSNYLRMQSDAPSDGDTTSVDYEINFAAQSTANDHLHYEQMFYLSDVIDTDYYALSMHVYEDDGTTVCASLATFPDKTIRYYSDGWHSTGLSVTEDQWQKWEIDYIIGNVNDTFSLTIDGTTASGLSTRGGVGHWDTIMVICKTNRGDLFLDEVVVPEPASIVLLVSGMVSLLAYAWRKRR